MNVYNIIEYIIYLFTILTTKEIIEKFRARGLRITTHRIAVYKAVLSSLHPDADSILKKLKEEYPNITVATIYNNLEALEKARLINKVLTEKGSMKYDGILTDHHHLLDTGEDRIMDYFDEELTKLLEEYFRKKPVPGFHVSKIMVQLIGSKSGHTTITKEK
ncbi:MAG: transcriptional repressor [Bacteroidales bacterium]|nr:transcriptional repressor [Bacteroidales bacterium]